MDQDFKGFNRVREIISNLTKGLDKQEKVHKIIQNALQNPNNFNSEDKHDLLMKIVA